MRRRAFITLLGGAAATWPFVARAQQPAMPVIGFLSSRPKDSDSALLVAAFREGLGQVGYVEGRDVAIEHRWAENQYDRFPALVADLIRRNVNVIALSGPAALPAKQATATIPIVFVTGDDPVEIGLVRTLSRPEGNLTGIMTLGGELAAKRIELLRQLLPAAKTFALLVNPKRRTLAETASQQGQAAARTLGLSLHIAHASTDHELEAAFASLPQRRVDGLVVGGDAFFNSRSQHLAELMVRHKLPTVYQYRQFTTAGGLMSYGGSLTDSFRLAGVYAGRILKGDKPAELPIQQSSKVELLINLKTARALGITLPIALLGRADEVIE